MALKRSEAESREESKRIGAATSIQAMIRGAQGRKALLEVLPLLHVQKQMRKYCVECESRMATKRCVQCKDRYCDSCYDIMHKKGYRRGHSWEPLIKVSETKEGTGYERGRTPSRPATAVWEEQWDVGARAKYWFNTATGEATWICPY